MVLSLGSKQVKAFNFPGTYSSKTMSLIIYVGASLSVLYQYFILIVIFDANDLVIVLIHQIPHNPARMDD
jgi:hypothetical protein